MNGMSLCLFTRGFEKDYHWIGDSPGSPVLENLVRGDNYPKLNQGVAVCVFKRERLVVLCSTTSQRDSNGRYIRLAIVIPFSDIKKIGAILLARLPMVEACEKFSLARGELNANFLEGINSFLLNILGAVSSRSLQGRECDFIDALGVHFYSENFNFAAFDFPSYLNGTSVALYAGKNKIEVASRLGMQSDAAKAEADFPSAEIALGISGNKIEGVGGADIDTLEGARYQKAISIFYFDETECQLGDFPKSDTLAKLVRNRKIYPKNSEGVVFYTDKTRKISVLFSKINFLSIAILIPCATLGEVEAVFFQRNLIVEKVKGFIPRLDSPYALRSIEYYINQISHQISISP